MQKSDLKKNYHKILLLAMLILLAAASLHQILTMNSPGGIILPKDYPGKDIEDVTMPLIKPAAVSLREAKHPYTPGKYIYCRNLNCNYMIHQSQYKCPWCKTPVRSIEGPKENIDSDKDGIDDNTEVKLQLNPQDPADALYDNDDDGFTNLEEYRKHDVNNPADHPSVITKTYFVRAVNINYPMSVATIDTGSDNPGNQKDLNKGGWDIYADIYTDRQISVFYKIGQIEKRTGYKVIDVGFENNKPFAVFKKEKEPLVKMFADGRRKVHYALFYFKNSLTGKESTVKIGEDFYLLDKNGEKWNFKLLEYISTEKAVIVRDSDESKNVKIPFFKKQTDKVTEPSGL